MTTGSFSILVSSAGRRVALQNCIRAAMEELALVGHIVAADASPYSSAGHTADFFVRVPPCNHKEFVPALLDVCATHDVRLVVPTIDTELLILAAHRPDFEAAGVAVAVSSPATVRIASDKRCTHEWLASHGFPTVRQTTPAGLLSAPDDWRFPLIVKPANGSSAKGVFTASSLADIDPQGHRDHVIQTIARGHEHTVDVLVNRAGVCVCAVPRRRLEVRAGEVSKAVTARGDDLQDLASRIAEALPGAYGALNIQIFVDPVTASMQVVEINARFGGGFPLTCRAGANYPKWMMEDILGRPSTADATAWQSGLVMLRYDEAVFIDAAALIRAE